MARALHVFKVYKPEVEGGIPEVIGLVAGGIPRWPGEILVAREKGWRQHAVMDGVPVTRTASLGTVWSLPIAPGFPLALRRRLKRADLVALHAPFPLADLTLALGLPRRTALVVHWHADIVRQRRLLPLLRPAIDRVLDRADLVLVSHESLIASSAFLPRVAAKCRAVPFGIDAAPWRTLDGEDAAAVARLRAAEPRLTVAVGRLVTYKGFDVLVDAMAAVDGTLAIVGTGAERENLEARVAARGLEKRVRLLGGLPQREIKRLLHAARLFAFPSVTIAEAFGIVQLEAMACGLPVVNTALPTGVPWVARDGREGLTVQPGEAGLLAAAITRLLDDAFLRDRLALGATRRFDQLFSREAFLAGVAQAYDDALAARRAAAA